MFDGEWKVIKQKPIYPQAYTWQIRETNHEQNEQISINADLELPARIRSHVASPKPYILQYGGVNHDDDDDGRDKEERNEN